MNRVEEKILIEWQKLYHDSNKASWYKKIELTLTKDLNQAEI